MTLASEDTSDWSGIGTNICLSGGAEGADLQWGMVAGWAGHRVFHFIFPGHRSRAPEAEKVVLTEEQLLLADPFLMKANDTLRRRWPVRNPFVASLLRRNYYQVCDAEAVYAVATIGDDGLVTGGTSWACQLFIDRHSGNACPVFVFDQLSEGWFVWSDFGFVPLEKPPVPSGVWAGIGSRELNSSGKAAIRDLFDYQAKIAA